MNPKQLGLTEYNDIILSVYDANPVANISESLTKTEELAKPEPEEKKPKKVGSNLLRKETHKLKLAAIANLKLTKRIFAYEKSRLKQLTVEFGKIQKPVTDSTKKERKKKKEEKDEKKSIRGWFGRSLRELAKKLTKKLTDQVRKFLRKRYIKNYKKLSPEQRKRVRDRKKFFDRQKRKYNRFKQRGGFGGLLRRRFLRAGTRLIGRRNAAKIRLFRQKGGLKGVVRRQFFKGVRGLKSAAKGVVSEVRQIKNLVGIGIQSAKGPVTQPAVNAATQAGRGIVAQTARNAFVGVLGKGGAKQVLGIFKNYVSPVLKRIPVIGTLIDFAINFFVFKEPLGKAAFKAIGAGLMAWLGGAIGSVIPVAGTFVGAALGGWAGDALAGLLYDAMFGGGAGGGAESSGSEAPDVNQFSEGGKVPAKPQLVMVGEGGEEEFIIPKSKLSYFLSSDTASDLVDGGASNVVASVQGYLSDSGLLGRAMGAMPELSKLGGLAKRKVKSKFGAIREISVGGTFKKIIDFIIESFTKLKDMLMGVVDKVKSIIPDLSGLSPWLKNQLRWIAKVAGGPFATLVETMIGGGAAKAASRQGTTEPYTGPITGDTFLPLPGATSIGAGSGQGFGASREGGRSHAGIDLTEHTLRDSRAPVAAYKTGKVIKSITSSQYPYGEIEIDHGGGLVTRYLHITPDSAVRVGQTVYGGQQIGKLYRYYNSAGQEQTHLHWEVYQNNKLVDPTRFARETKNKISSPLSSERAKQQHEQSSSSAPPSPPLGKVLRSTNVDGWIYTEREGGKYYENGKPITREKYEAIKRNHPTDFGLQASVLPLNRKDTSSNLENVEDNYQEEMLLAMEPQVIVQTQYIPIPISMGGSAGGYQRSSSWLPGVVGA